MIDFLCAACEMKDHFVTNAASVANAANSSGITDRGLAYLGAGLSVLAAIGAGIGQGMATAHACSGVARNPEAVSAIRTMLIIGAAIVESASVYGLLISFLLIFVAK